jgi:hypothetical protein
VRFEVFTAVRMMTLCFWVSAPCNLAGRRQRHGETYCLLLQGWRWRQYVFRNVGFYRRVYTALKPRRTVSWNCITVQREEDSFPPTLTGHDTLVWGKSFITMQCDSLEEHICICNKWTSRPRDMQNRTESIRLALQLSTLVTAKSFVASRLCKLYQKRLKNDCTNIIKLIRRRDYEISDVSWDFIIFQHSVFQERRFFFSWL